MTQPIINHAITSLPWPLITLDFVASALHTHSFPIEVGICRWRAPDAPLESWSTLILPTNYWLIVGIRSDQSQKVHGISHEDLATSGHTRTPHRASPDAERLMRASQASCL